VRLLVPKEEVPAAPAATQGPAQPGKARLSGRGKRAAPEPAGVAPSELASKRDELAKRFAELQWDLGGLVYEMAARDHIRLDVVVRRAAKLQAVDAELAEVERLLKLEDAGAAGNCPACGALYARGAAYCWQCGNDLLPKTAASTQPVAVPAEPPPTATQSVGAKATEVAQASAPPVPAPPAAR
jgi:hypothetical protein